MDRAPSAAEAEKTPPHVVANFRSIALPMVPGALDVVVDFQLACLACSAETFHISAFPVVAPNPSPYFDVQPGETLYRPPHNLKCVLCGAEASLFDVRTQGYDGVLNGGGTYESGTEGKAFMPGLFHIVVSLAYNAELAELRELADEASVRASDLFDWIAIHGKATDGGQNIELSYECA